MLTVGCDPEFQLFRGNEFKSAHEYIPGTKYDPHKLHKGTVQVDGTAVEIGIDPASSPAEFVENIWTVLAQVRQLLPPGFRFEFKSAVEVPNQYWGTLPERVKILGCEPDFTPKNPFIPREPPQRPGTWCMFGGHVHIGWTSVKDVYSKEHMANCALVSSIFGEGFRKYAHLWDPDTMRKTMYGTQDEFRPKPFGVECRAPSGAWLGRPEVWPWIFDLAKWSVQVSQGERVECPKLECV